MTHTDDAIQNGRWDLAKYRGITSVGLILVAIEIFYSVNALECVGFNVFHMTIFLIIDLYFNVSVRLIDTESSPLPPNNIISVKHGSVVVLTTFPVLVASEIVKITSSTHSDDNIGKMTTFPFQWFDISIALSPCCSVTGNYTEK